MSWEEYLRAPIDHFQLWPHRQSLSKDFAPLRQYIENIYAQIRPNAVTILGAGMLNDIPVKVMMEDGAHVSFVDWLPHITQLSLEELVVARSDKENKCILSARSAIAADYCEKYLKPDCAPSSKCKNSNIICDSLSNWLACQAFSPGHKFKIFNQDVTGGIAGQLAEIFSRITKESKNLKNTLNRMLKDIEKVRSAPAPLSPKDYSGDLVLSSLVVSQFDFEPYGYLIKCLNQAFPDFLNAEDPLVSHRLLEIRDRIFYIQLRSHLQQLKAIIRPGGWGILAFEVATEISPDSEKYFFPHGMERIITEIRNNFTIDFSLTGENSPTTRIKNRDQKSWVGIFPVR